ncbi:hypothetical protein NA57DRAFT_15165, partial [Rhizodiscina lignyota]
SDDEFYTIPIKDQRVFGAGIKRKRVPFVAASSPATSATATPPTSARSIAERYLSIVGVGPEAERSVSAPPTVGPVEEAELAKCDICNRPIDDDSTAVPHEASLAHQVCLEHSHGPSHIDRQRKGLSYLQAYGWNPDSRQGLGASGEGRLYPVKPKEKRDTVGLGVDIKALKAGKVAQKVERLNAKEVRQREANDKKRKDRIQKMFTANDDVERYL